MPQFTPGGVRLRSIRHRANLDPRQLADAAGLSLHQYFALESGDKLYQGITLYKLAKLARAMAMQPTQLFTDDPPAGGSPQAVFAPLVHAVRAELKRRGCAQSALEAEIGWKLGDFVERPKAAWAWTVDGLRAVCAAVGLDWLASLPQDRKHSAGLVEVSRFDDVTAKQSA